MVLYGSIELISIKAIVGVLTLALCFNSTLSANAIVLIHVHNKYFYTKMYFL